MSQDEELSPAALPVTVRPIETRLGCALAERELVPGPDGEPILELGVSLSSATPTGVHTVIVPAEQAGPYAVAILEICREIVARKALEPKTKLEIPKLIVPGSVDELLDERHRP